MQLLGPLVTDKIDLRSKYNLIDFIASDNAVKTIEELHHELYLYKLNTYKYVLYS